MQKTSSRRSPPTAAPPMMPALTTVLAPCHLALAFCTRAFLFCASIRFLMLSMTPGLLSPSWTGTTFTTAGALSGTEETLVLGGIGGGVAGFGVDGNRPFADLAGIHFSMP